MRWFHAFLCKAALALFSPLYFCPLIHYKNVQINLFFAIGVLIVALFQNDVIVYDSSRSQSGGSLMDLYI